ncbi:MAG: ABC transporter permease [Spirochaetales bacterium]|nr:ABC transporter permease [Spirochaetales bacterium]
MIYVLISLRNLKKNLGKNALTLTMISFGMTALYVYTGSNTQMFRQFRESVIHDQYGHFQLYERGYTDADSKDALAHLVKNYSFIEEALLQDSDLDFLAPRLHFSGIASGDEKSIIIKGFGGVPEAEARMEYGRVYRGNFLESDGSAQTVMGEEALRKSGLGIGGYATVLAGMSSGGMTAADFRITGTRKGCGEGDRLNGMFMISDLSSVQELLGVPGSVDTIIVHLAAGITADDKEDDIRIFCERHGLEYRRWDELALFYERSRQVFAMNEHILTAIILVISVFIIINTLYMAYMSRMREIATMRAIGTTKAQIARIILNESLILSVTGCTFGVLVAAVISFIVFVTGGIHHPPSVFNEESYYTFIQPEAPVIAAYFVLFMLVSAAASLVIALRAFKFSIAECLRWI